MVECHVKDERFPRFAGEFTLLRSLCIFGLPRRLKPLVRKEKANHQKKFVQ